MIILWWMMRGLRGEWEHLRGTRPSTLRNWRVECDCTEWYNRPTADRFQCLLEMLNPPPKLVTQVSRDSPLGFSKLTGSDRVDCEQTVGTTPVLALYLATMRSFMAVYTSSVTPGMAPARGLAPQGFRV